MAPPCVPSPASPAATQQRGLVATAIRGLLRPRLRRLALGHPRGTRAGTAPARGDLLGGGGWRWLGERALQLRHRQAHNGPPRETECCRQPVEALLGLAVGVDLDSPLDHGAPPPTTVR